MYAFLCWKSTNCDITFICKNRLLISVHLPIHIIIFMTVEYVNHKCIVSEFHVLKFICYSFWVPFLQKYLFERMAINVLQADRQVSKNWFALASVPPLKKSVCLIFYRREFALLDLVCTACISNLGKTLTLEIHQLENNHKSYTKAYVSFYKFKVCYRAISPLDTGATSSLNYWMNYCSLSRPAFIPSGLPPLPFPPAIRSPYSEQVSNLGQSLHCTFSLLFFSFLLATLCGGADS